MAIGARLALVFEAIVADYEAQLPDRRQRLLHLRLDDGARINGWDASMPGVDLEDLRALERHGLLELEDASGGHTFVKPTAAGRRAVPVVRLLSGLDELAGSAADARTREQAARAWAALAELGVGTIAALVER